MFRMKTPRKRRDAAMAHIEARDITLTYLPDAERGGAGRPRRQFWHRDFRISLHRWAERVRQVDAFEYRGRFLSPTAGEIRIAGAPVKGYGTDRGVVFQDFAQLFPWRTALGNVAFGLEMKGVPKTEREAIALE